MNSVERQALRGILEKGAAACSLQMEKISRAAWEPARFAVDQEAESALESMMGGVTGDLYGSWFTVPGGAFLVVVPRACGLRLTDRFTVDHAATIDMLDQRESVVLAEIANILVNAFVSALADALDEVLIVSEPKPMLDCTRDLLVKFLGRQSRAERYSAACLAGVGSKALSAELAVVFFVEPATLERLRAA